ncbi:MAG TPA: hypothetical protein VH637_15635 [Streptosporangiaceae bacterium]|jgi:hypothetical protein
MKASTGLALLSIGAILCFAVGVHPSFISPQIAGLVLMLTGVAGLFLGQAGTGWFDRQLARLKELLAQDDESPDSRVPLGDLFGEPAAGTPAQPATRVRQETGA